MVDDLNSAYLGVAEVFIIPVAEHQHIQSTGLKIAFLIDLQFMNVFVTTN